MNFTVSDIYNKSRSRMKEFTRRFRSEEEYDTSWIMIID